MTPSCAVPVPASRSHPSPSRLTLSLIHISEPVAKYFTKGRMAVVEGRLQLRDWTDKDGGKRRSAEVVADHVYFGDSKKDAEMPAQSNSSGGAFSEVEDDGELPC